MGPVMAKVPLIIIPTSALVGVLQSIAPGDISIIASIERLGLVGVLIILVAVLWRELREVQKKRDEERDSDHKAAMAAQSQMTAALTSNTQVMQSNTEMMHGVKEVVSRFVTVRDAMDDHPKKGR